MRIAPHLRGLHKLLSGFAGPRSKWCAPLPARATPSWPPNTSMRLRLHRSGPRGEPCRRCCPEGTHEKRSVQRIQPGGKSGQARRERVVAGRSERDSLEAVVGAKLLEGAAGEQAQVRAARGVRLPALWIERVADDHLVAHVYGHGLPPERERYDVVPARQVVGRDAHEAAGGEHAAYLGEQSVGSGYVLDYLVGVHDVEPLAVERQAVREVAPVHLDPTGAGRGGMRLDQLHPCNPSGTEPLGDAHGKASIARAQVQQAGSRPRREHLEDGAPVLLLGGLKQSPEIPHGMHSPFMRIALACDCLYPNTVGGAERWLRELALALSAEHDVTYVTRRQWRRGENPIPGVRCLAVVPGGRLYTEAGRRRVAPALSFGAGCFLHFVLNRRRYDIVDCLSFPYVPLLGSAPRLWERAARLSTASGSSACRTAGGGPTAVWSAAPPGRLLQRLCIRLSPAAFAFSDLTETRLRAAGFSGPLHRLGGLWAGAAPPSGGAQREELVVLVAEAAAAGTPVVVCRSPDSAAGELVEEGVNGAFATCAAPPEIGEAIVRVLDGGRSCAPGTETGLRRTGEGCRWRARSGR